MLQLLQRLLGRAPKSQLPPFNFALNRYRARKKWPPNLLELTEKQQFRFERKFKRRVRLKAIRPQWNRWTKIVQWNLIGFIVVYAVFFHDFAQDPMNPRPGEQPFQGLRNRMKELYSGLWTHSLNEPRGSNLRKHPRSADDETDAHATEQTGRS